MSAPLTERFIRLVCGQASFEQGESDYRAGKVRLADYDPDRPVYEASVTGSGMYRVHAELDRNGDVRAECTCPAFDA
ncbi:SWIM zinc finger family protein [Paenibacillus sp. y28]|uniref:SWIM zinc finger family protein n=1 Tax=Paenibacillus sp. y28 TaxID=3129110 RepID=UPI003018676B